MRSMNGGGEEVISGGQPADARGTTIQVVKKPTWWTIGMWMVFFVAQVALIRVFFVVLSIDWSTKPLISKWGAKGSVCAAFTSSFFFGLLMFLKTDGCPRLTNVLLSAFLITGVGSCVMAAVAIMFYL